MIDLFILKMVILIIACGISAYTDMKKGYIHNWLSVPLIIIGLLFLIYDSFFALVPLGKLYFFKVLGIGIVIYILGFFFYYYGKLGGGDIKLFLGIHFVLPYYQGELFILWVVLISCLFSVLFVSLKYLIVLYKKLGSQKMKQLVSKRKNLVLNNLFLFIFFIVVICLSIFIGNMSKYLYILLIPILLGLLVSIFQPEINKYIYLKQKPVSKLEEGDVIAKEYLSKEVMGKLNLKGKLVLENKDIQNIKQLKIKNFPIYEYLPRLAIYILFSVVFVLCFGNYVLF
ncbi:MAG TPA: A24 family peptidase [archaeon]|nr:A24 family peptidase [archaeon]